MARNGFTGPELVCGNRQEVCLHRDWTLAAAHVRTNHVYLVVDSDQTAEQAMNAFKAYAGRVLNQMALDRPDRRRRAVLDAAS